jgi:hypothetical protein
VNGDRHTAQSGELLGSAASADAIVNSGSESISRCFSSSPAAAAAFFPASAGAAAVAAGLATDASAVLPAEPAASSRWVRGSGGPDDDDDERSERKRSRRWMETEARNTKASSAAMIMNEGRKDVDAE